MPLAERYPHFQLLFAEPFPTLLSTALFQSPPACLVSAAAAEARKWDYANVVALTKRVGAAL
jgi:hypothetical protein